jgi:hypothetical protein
LLARQTWERTRSGARPQLSWRAASASCEEVSGAEVNISVIVAAAQVSSRQQGSETPSGRSARQLRIVYGDGVSSPEQPNRRNLLIGAVVMLLGVVLLAVPAGQVVDFVGLAVIVVAAVLMLRAFGWIFTRRG